jgi:ferredoxin, 2Fe-2S
MPVIVITNLFNKTISVTDTRLPLLRHLQDNRMDWMHACGGKGRCTTCKVNVLEGHENISSATPAENRYRAMGALLENERLSCQVRITGDITIAVPDDSKLPHITYS